ncbi:hypothetical protein [Bosea sp. (in: a-proteobacteria)]|uniref:hypothetical protein n=1 Tax=Bosea sp. (in: a-proteobacteria) TaxID=1871050 RepID=UPI00273367B8|nr:hypothetical protein [Bosea sp. (in: a-proteobacteria)]MDP3409814.1 hypothetical protein [Bosea sp. (in: a-proteobacteria)]
MSGTINCDRSGYRSFSFSASSYPVEFRKEQTLTGLILGERCVVRGGAVDRYDIIGTLNELTFIVQHPPPPPALPCGFQRRDGSNDPASFLIEMGRTSGFFDFHRDTYFVPDNLILACADGGTVNSQSQVATGCVGTGRVVSSMSMRYACSSSRIRVTVDPDCSNLGNTDWTFTLTCGRP